MAAEGLVKVLMVLVFFCCVNESHAGEFCYKKYSYGYRSTWSTTYCTYGCCGPDWDEYCCGAEVGLIVGCVFAGILVISIIVAVVCCCIKKQSHSGRVVQPATAPPRPGANVTVVYTGTSGHYPMGPAHPMQPPAYKQYDNPPPAYNYSDPAYPPTSPGYSAASNPTPQQPPLPGFSAASNPTPQQPPPPGFSAASNPTPQQPPPPGFNVAAAPSATAPPNTNLPPQ